MNHTDFLSKPYIIVFLTLKKKGYLKFDINENDKREKIISFTDSGIQYCSSTLSSLFEIEEYICRNIEQDKLIQAIETRKLFNTLFEKEMEREIKDERNRKNSL